MRFVFSSVVEGIDGCEEQVGQRHELNTQQEKLVVHFDPVLDFLLRLEDKDDGVHNKPEKEKDAYRYPWVGWNFGRVLQSLWNFAALIHIEPQYKRGLRHRLDTELQPFSDDLSADSEHDEDSCRCPSIFEGIQLHWTDKQSQKAQYHQNCRTDLQCRSQPFMPFDLSWWGPVSRWMGLNC